MMQRGTTKQVVLGILKEMNEPLKVKDIFDLLPKETSITLDGLKWNLNSLAKDPSSGVMAVPSASYYNAPLLYSMKEAAKPKEEDKTVSFKNSEGYVDPTAAAALKNTMNASSLEKNFCKVSPGEIWTMQDTDRYSRDTPIKYLVVSIVGNTCIVLECRTDMAGFDAHLDVEINKCGIAYIAPRRILPRTARYFDRYQASLPDDIFRKVKEKLANVLGLDIPEERVIEKIVEKEVPVEKIIEKEVPVEVIKEVSADNSKELEMARLEAKVWKDAFYTMCGKENK